MQGFDGAVVMVSHDRYLLDETVNMIAELDRGRITLWPGTYSEYAVAREIALARQQELYVTQQKEIARLEEAIRRFRHWAHIEVNERHIKQARVKQRQIDRMEKVERPVLERRKVGLTLRSEQRGGQRVVELRGVVVGFDDTPVLDGVDLTVVRGERVGVIGANGSGKSALARTLVGELPLLGGERWIGPSIQVGHLAQEPSIARDRARRRSTQCGACARIEEGAAVQLLMRFLFNYEQVRQPLSQLSGGERTRLELLLLMRGGANLLVLDEPTNHLDIDSSRCSRMRSSATTARSCSCPTTATSSTGSPTASSRCATAASTSPRAATATGTGRPRGARRGCVCRAPASPEAGARRESNAWSLDVATFAAVRNGEVPKSLGS